MSCEPIEVKEDLPDASDWSEWWERTSISSMGAVWGVEEPCSDGCLALEGGGREGRCEGGRKKEGGLFWGEGERLRPFFFAEPLLWPFDYALRQ